jgi:hypothetical protein
MRELDVVEVIRSVGSVAAGTRGTVIVLHGDRATVELPDARRLSDLLDLPVEALRVVEPVFSQSA